MEKEEGINFFKKTKSPKKIVTFLGAEMVRGNPKIDKQLDSMSEISPPL